MSRAMRANQPKWCRFPRPVSACRRVKSRVLPVTSMLPKSLMFSLSHSGSDARLALAFLHANMNGAQKAISTC